MDSTRSFRAAHGVSDTSCTLTEVRKTGKASQGQDEIFCRIDAKFKEATIPLHHSAWRKALRAGWT
jgi:hypothetical protein